MGVAKVFMSSLLILVVSYVIIVWNSNTFEPESLVGKNVLLTGASSGIGKATAIQYAKYGANVFITARRENLLREVVAMCKDVGKPNAKFGYIAADMANYTTETKRVVKAAVTFLGSIDHLILNHHILGSPERLGHGWSGTADELSNLRAQFDIGMISYVHMTAHALPHLKKSGDGRLGIMGSILGKTTARSVPSYCAVKFALDGFYGSLRELFEHDQCNITVTYYIIGPVATETIMSMPPGGPTLFDMDWAMFLMPATTPELTADEIVKATTRGDAELYFPLLFGYIPGGYRVIPLIRHVWHNLLYVS